jgi:molybdate transport repressor ModE-like protein
MLDAKRLRVLREVAKQGSFSAAADSLSYTQSAVSQQIAALEKETGAKLVDRNARGIRMTDAGEALVRHADAILTRMCDAEAELEAIAGLRGGRVRLASFTTAGSTFVPSAIAAFHDRYPGVELRFVEADPPDSVPMLKSGELDVAIVYDPYGEGDAELDRTPLLDDPMNVVLPLGHRLADKAKIRLKDLQEDRWIQTSQSCPCSMIVNDACRRAGFEPQTAFETDDYMTVQGLVAAGVGVAMVPDLGLAASRPDIVVRPVAGEQITRKIDAVALPGSLKQPATGAMIEILCEAAENYRGGGARLAVAS